MLKKILVLLSLAVLVACGSPNESGADKKLTLTLWHPWSGESAKPIENAVKEYERTHPLVKIKLTGNVTMEKSLAAIYSGTGPDISIDLGMDNVGRFCASQVWKSLNGYLEQDAGFISLFPKSVISGTRYEGNQCSLPVMTDVYSLYFNRQILEENGFMTAPRTTEDLIRYSKKITKFGSAGEIIQAGFVPWTGYYGASWGGSFASYMFGAKWYTEAGNSNFSTDPKWLDAMEWQHRFISEVYGQGDFMLGSRRLQEFVAGAGDEWGCAHDLQTGRSAMVFDGEWRTQSTCAEDLENGINALDLGVAPIPVAKDIVDDYGFSAVGGPVAGISSKSVNQDAAWSFLKFLTTSDSMMKDGFDYWWQAPSTVQGITTLSNETSMENWKIVLGMISHPKSKWRDVSIIGNKDLDLINGVFTDLQLGVNEKGNDQQNISRFKSELKKLGNKVNFEIEKSG